MTMAASSEQPLDTPSSPARGSRLAALVVLFKLRVVALLLFAGVGGAMIASAGAPHLGDLGLAVLAGALATSGASALNQYLERRTDGAMKRTRRRPLVSGQVNATAVLIVSLGLIALAVLIALAMGNPALAFFLGLGAFIYVGIYTIWLKPRSVLNVVIGGSAGSVVVLGGGAAAGQWSDPGVIGLALLLFAWSPTHFWSLALAYHADYRRAGVPMLPVVVSPRRAVFWMLAHASATALFGLLLALHGALGWVYTVPVTLVTAWMLREMAMLLHDTSGPRAMRAFKASNSYLGVVLLAITVATLV